MNETEDTRMVDAWDCWKSALAFRCARHAHPKALSDRTLWTTFSAGFVAADDDCQSRIDAAVAKERERCEQETRRYAGLYPPHSDGRNTFAMLADFIAAGPTPTTEEGA